MLFEEKVEEIKNEIVEETSKIIKIKSVTDVKGNGMPFGEGVNQALESVLELGEKLGFRTKNLDGYAGYLEWGEGEECVGVLGHLDVVPEGDGWIYPPYGGEVHDGKIYGRGAIDDKGPMMACVYGLYALKEIGYKPNKRIRIIFGTDEENGTCMDTEYYLKKEKPLDLGFTPDANFPIIYAEKGITFFNIKKSFDFSDEEKIQYIKGGQRPNIVPDYCEIGIRTKDKEIIIKKIEEFKDQTKFQLTYEETDELLVIKSIGNSAHGSTPELGKNAIMQAIMFLDDIKICKGDIGKTISFLAKNIGMQTRGEDFGVFLKDDVSGELSFNVGTIEMNATMISIGMNIRYPVTKTYEDLMKPFEEKISTMNFKVENMIHQAPLYFSKEHKLIGVLSKVYEEQTGKKAELLAIGGGTYAKEMPNVVAFGPIEIGEPELEHQPNEYIEIEQLIKLTKIYGNALKELAELH